jgi:hypothetical protein
LEERAGFHCLQGIFCSDDYKQWLLCKFSFSFGKFPASYYNFQLIDLAGKNKKEAAEDQRSANGL